jgi:UDP-glucose 4-epimerase
MVLDGSRILVTGGTGSFGNAFVNYLLKTCNPGEIVILSRDEKKQHDMRNTLDDSRIKFIIGDVRDRDRVFSCMRGVDYIFHAAALKQVPSCEFFPLEAVKTNVIGTGNVLDAAEAYEVKKVVVLSTDKAVYPINAMGQSKALLEKLMVAKGREGDSGTVFCGVRYGNVMYSRGSVIPLFVNCIKNGRPIPITHGDMTRFLLPLPKAVELVLVALDKGQPGEILVRKAPAATVSDLAQACLNIFGANNETVTLGIRHGEKMHETLVTREELLRSEELDHFYKIGCDHKMDYDKYFSKGRLQDIPEEGYTSANTQRLSISETEQLLLSLEDIQKELR